MPFPSTMPTTPRFTTAQLAEINKTLENGITEDILKWTNDTFGNTSAQMSSFGLEDQALFHIYWSVNPKRQLLIFYYVIIFLM
ncbi:MAG TPA: hypothetical protein QF694_01565, partial [Dehalococcoidia bacterium]|nr:hypothetical protein [Dehalococcoidia bacterium]